jgi:hypothetical protein
MIFKGILSPSNGGEGMHDVGHEHASKKETTPRRHRHVQLQPPLSRYFSSDIHHDAGGTRAGQEMLDKDAKCLL